MVDGNRSTHETGLWTGKDTNLKITRTLVRKAVTVSTLPSVLVLSLTVCQISRCYAQTPAQPDAPTKVAALNEPAPVTDVSPNRPATAAPDPASSADIARELAAMKARIELLETELKSRTVTTNASLAPVIPARAAPLPVTAPTEATAQTPSDSSAAKPEKAAPTEPFAFADWTWLNGNARNKDAVWDSKFFTPEIRFDTDFVSSLNHPKDDSLGGSTEIFRSNEVQVEQISFGGDFHWQDVRGRILTMGGMFGVTTPRNDASVGRGQWDLRGAYKYFAEAYGGYHFDVNHGLNVDAGIFVSYIGLFSYYNFDNWAYQPSYVSSNTPWFFNGVRVQWFPTDKLKIEPWFINGWQSYGRFGNRPGLGGQILYRPKPWVSLVFNNYGMGEDTLGLNGARSRIHTDNSIEIKYYDHPEKTLDKMAFSLTGDLGCEYGGGAACFGDKKSAGQVTAYKQVFAGWMLYNRWWFKKDLYGLTLGGGVLDNPGRYLTLLQPINGADAVSGSPYFPENPGLIYKAWDNSVTFDYMPRQYITFLWEFGYRHANVPYFTGRGGITPPGGNNNSPADYVCMDGSSTGFGWAVNPGNPTDANGANLGLAQSTCNANSHGGLWTPDLRKDEPSIRMAIMVKF
jgi:Putative beta-barrel porin-2, OmpL-like. bbp2